jgi:hypothetical protein
VGEGEGGIMLGYDALFNRGFEFHQFVHFGDGTPGGPTRLVEQLVCDGSPANRPLRGIDQRSFDRGDDRLRTIKCRGRQRQQVDVFASDVRAPNQLR